MPEPDVVSGSNDLAETGPDEEAVLAERLRLVAESLNAEFRGLSKAEAERLVLVAAHDVLSSASVMQFVPTFAQRRARSLLHNGYSPAGPEATTDTLDLSPPAAAAPHAPVTPAPQVAPPYAATDVRAPGPSDGTGLRPQTTHTLAPAWPDDFYASEAKRLLERARNLRASSLSSLQLDSPA